MSTLSDTDFALPLTNMFPAGNSGIPVAATVTQGGGFSGLLLQAQSSGELSPESPNDTEVTDVSDQKILQFTEMTEEEVLLESENPLEFADSSNRTIDAEAVPNNAELRVTELPPSVVAQPKDRPASTEQSQIDNSATRLRTEQSEVQIVSSRETFASVESVTPAATELSIEDAEAPDILQVRTGLAEDGQVYKVVGNTAAAVPIKEHRQVSNNGRYDRVINSDATPVVGNRSGSIDLTRAANLLNAQELPVETKVLSAPDLSVGKETLTAQQPGLTERSFGQSVAVAATAGNTPAMQQVRDFDQARAEIPSSSKVTLRSQPANPAVFTTDTRANELNSLRILPELQRNLVQPVNVQLAASVPVTMQATATPSPLAQTFSASVSADPIQDVQMVQDQLVQDRRSPVSQSAKDFDPAMFARSVQMKNELPVQGSGDGFTSFRTLTPSVTGTGQIALQTLQAGLLTTAGTNTAPDSLAPPLPVSSIAMKQAGWDQSLSTNVSFMLREDISSANIRLKPAELGSMNIQLSVQSDQLNVNIAASNALTRETVEASMPRLREQFASLGFNQVDVNVGNPGPGDRSAQQMANRDGNAPDNGYMRHGDTREAEDGEVLVQQQWVSRHNGVLDTFA